MVNWFCRKIFKLLFDVNILCYVGLHYGIASECFQLVDNLCCFDHVSCIIIIHSETERKIYPQNIRIYRSLYIYVTESAKTSLICT